MPVAFSILDYFKNLGIFLKLAGFNYHHNVFIQNKASPKNCSWCVIIKKIDCQLKIIRRINHQIKLWKRNRFCRIITLYHIESLNYDRIEVRIPSNHCIYQIWPHVFNSVPKSKTTALCNSFTINQHVAKDLTKNFPLKMFSCHLFKRTY